MAPIWTKSSLPKGFAKSGKTLQPPMQAHWERLRDRPVYCSEENNFVLSFRVRTDPK